MIKQSPNVPEFIQKILEIIMRQPQIVNWSEDGLQLVILDQLNFRQVVLPYFFRHKKMQSFVRQLNMYGFRKICRSKNSINFKNDNFQRDFPEKLVHIKRRKIYIAQQKVQNFKNQRSLIDTINSRYSFTHPSLPILVTELINFKNKNVWETQNLKKQIDDIGRQVNKRKFKKIKPILTSTREAINSVNGLGNSINVSIQKMKMTISEENALQKTASSLAPIISNLVPFTFFKSQQSLLKLQPSLEPNEEKTVMNQNKSDKSIKNPCFNGLGISALCSFNSVTKFIS